MKKSTAPGQFEFGLDPLWVRIEFGLSLVCSGVHSARLRVAVRYSKMCFDFSVSLLRCVFQFALDLLWICSEFALDLL